MGSLEGGKAVVCYFKSQSHEYITLPRVAQTFSQFSKRPPYIFRLPSYLGKEVDVRTSENVGYLRYYPKIVQIMPSDLPLALSFMREQKSTSR